MLHKPSHIVNTLLNRAKQDKIKDMTHLKLQKLVYLLNGYVLAVTGKSMIGEEFEAWPYGPVLSSLYHTLKVYGRSRVTDYIKEIDPITGNISAGTVNCADKEFHEILNLVWNQYKQDDGLALSKLTHAHGSPWYKARSACSLYLEKDDIKKDFLKKDDVKAHFKKNTKEEQ